MSSKYFLHSQHLRDCWPKSPELFNDGYLRGMDIDKDDDLSTYSMSELSIDPAFRGLGFLPTNWFDAFLLVGGHNKNINAPPNYFNKSHLLQIDFRYLAAFHYLCQSRTDGNLEVLSWDWPQTFNEAVSLSKMRFAMIELAGGVIKSVNSTTNSAGGQGGGISIGLCSFAKLNPESLEIEKTLLVPYDLFRVCYQHGQPVSAIRNVPLP